MSRFLRTSIGYGIAGLVLLVLVVGFWHANRADRRGSPAAGSHVTLETNSESNEPGWPQFRGPTFDAVSTETEIADSWPDVGPPVIWTRELGQGYSSFAAVGNKVYTQCQSIYRQSVVCLDAQTGDTIWSHNYDWPFEGGGLYPGPRSTPTLHNGRLYFAAPDGTIGCLDAETGKPIWSTNPKKQYRGRGTDFGYASSPVVVEDKVIVPVGGLDASVVALDATHGTIVWTRRIPW